MSASAIAPSKIATVLRVYLSEMATPQPAGRQQSTWLIKVTGDHAAPGWWMSGAAACGLLATFLLYLGIAKER
jgi:hypothetical protein